MRGARVSRDTVLCFADGPGASSGVGAPARRLPQPRKRSARSRLPAILAPIAAMNRKGIEGVSAELTFVTHADALSLCFVAGGTSHRCRGHTQGLTSCREMLGKVGRMSAPTLRLATWAYSSGGCAVNPRWGLPVTSASRSGLARCRPLACVAEVGERQARNLVRAIRVVQGPPLDATELPEALKGYAFP